MTLMQYLQTNASVAFPITGRLVTPKGASMRESTILVEGFSSMLLQSTLNQSQGEMRRSMG